MWIMELAMKTIAADSSIGSQSKLSPVMTTSFGVDDLFPRTETPGVQLSETFDLSLSPPQAQRTQSPRREPLRFLCALCACGGERGSHYRSTQFVNLLF